MKAVWENNILEVEKCSTMSETSRNQGGGVCPGWWHSPGGLSENERWVENSESTKDSGPAQGQPGSRTEGWVRSHSFSSLGLSFSTYFLFKLPAESQKVRTATAEL